MSLVVGYTGYFDIKRNYRLDISSKELIWTVSRSNRQRMKQLHLDKIERKIKYPSTQQISNGVISFTVHYTDKSQSEESQRLFQRYPLTICNFLLNAKLKTDYIQDYIDLFGVSVTHEYNLYDLAMLKYEERDRLVQITALSPISNDLQIFPFMQKHIKKYIVNHIQWNEQQQKWERLKRLSNGTALIPSGGPMSVSANEIDIICSKQQLPIVENYIVQNYLLTQKNKVLQKHYDNNAEKWMDYFEQCIYKRLDQKRYWDKWTEETIFMSPDNKNDECDKVLIKYGNTKSWEFKNKAETKETITFGMDELREFFGDDIQTNHKDKEEKFMVTATKMTLTYDLNKPVEKNFKIGIYIKKTELKQTK